MIYVDANNLYGWAMSKTLSINYFKWDNNLEEFTADFVKNYDEDSDRGYLLEVYVEYPKELYEAHRDLPFLPIKIDKLLTTVEDKENYFLHIYALKQALLHGLILKKFIEQFLSIKKEY